MDLLADSVAVLATTVLGLSAGAVLAEGAVLVPFWRGMAPTEFLAWYRQHAGLLFWFFGPLEVVAGGSAVAAGILGWLGGAADLLLLALAAGFSVLVLAAFPVYFKNANATFAAGTIPPDRVAAELVNWSAWHWVRTSLAVLAFVCSLLALVRPGSASGG